MHPVDVPSIFITDASIVSGEIKYIGTQTKTRDGSVYAETTYQINWPEAVVTYQQFDVRWSFKDIQYSKDFLAEKEKQWNRQRSRADKSALFSGKEDRNESITYGRLAFGNGSI